MNRFRFLSLLLVAMLALAGCEKKSSSSAPTTEASGPQEETVDEECPLPTVPNQPPQANFSASTQAPFTQEVVFFNDLSTDNDGTITQVFYDFGDTEGLYERNTTHKYAAAGTYLVTQIVSDDKGAHDQKCSIISMLFSLCLLS